MLLITLLIVLTPQIHFSFSLDQEAQASHHSYSLPGDIAGQMLIQQLYKQFFIVALEMLESSVHTVVPGVFYFSAACARLLSVRPLLAAPG